MVDLIVEWYDSGWWTCFFSHDIYSDLDCAFVVFENGAHFEIDVCAVDDTDVDDADVDGADVDDADVDDDENDVGVAECSAGLDS